MNQIELIDATTPVELGVADEVIRGLKERLTGLSADTQPGYQIVKAGIVEVRKHRTGVEKCRKALKASALDWGRKVDSEAKRVTDLLVAIETPLKVEKQRIDDEVERLRKKEEEKERLVIEAKERSERKARQAEEEAKRETERKEREAEAAKLSEDRKALEAARRQLEDERREQQQEFIKAEQKLRAAKKRVEDEQRAIQEKAANEAAAKQAAALKICEEEQRAKAAEAEKVRRSEEKAEAARLAEERKPDIEKLREFSLSIETLPRPEMKTEWGSQTLRWVEDLLINAAIIASTHVPNDERAAADAAETVMDQSPQESPGVGPVR